MKIMIVADNYPPLRSSAAVQIEDLADEFQKNGHCPTVVTPTPELSDKWVLEYRNGVRVLRVKTMKMRDIYYVKRVFSEAVTPFVIRRRLLQSGLLTETWDGIIWYSPSIFFGPLISFLKKKLKCPSYLILRDIFPEWAVDVGLMGRGLPYRFFKFIEKTQYRSADTIGIQSEAARPYLHSFLKRKIPEIDLLQNWLADSSAFDCTIEIAQTALAGRKICVYAGNMGVAQDVSVFLDLASYMQDRDNIGFLFVGRGSDVKRLKQRAETEGLNNVLFLDEIDPDEISGLLAQCHIGLLALDPRHRTNNIPGKFLTYMRDSLPVLACVNPGNNLTTMINESRVGFASETRNTAALKEGLLMLLHASEDHADTAVRCRRIYLELFSPPAAVEAIISRLQPDVYDRIVDGQ